MPPQNLIPLLFIRPLRLFVPAENLRRVRIVVLKVTHLPFVAIIWAYEGSRRYVSHHVHSPPAMTMPFSPIQPFSASRTSLNRNVSRLPALNRTSLLVTSTPSKERQSYGDFSNERGAASGTADSVADLMAMVEKLSSQVEELTSMVAGQQKD